MIISKTLEIYEDTKNGVFKLALDGSAIEDVTGFSLMQEKNKPAELNLTVCIRDTISVQLQ